MRLKRAKENDDGWSDWIRPKMKGYRLACCDCGLVHTIDFHVAERDGEFFVEYRASRNNRSTGQFRRHNKKRTT